MFLILQARVPAAVKGDIGEAILSFALELLSKGHKADFSSKNIKNSKNLETETGLESLRGHLR